MAGVQQASLPSSTLVRCAVTHLGGDVHTDAVPGRGGACALPKLIQRLSGRATIAAPGRCEQLAVAHGVRCRLGAQRAALTPELRVVRCGVIVPHVAGQEGTAVPVQHAAGLANQPGGPGVCCCERARSMPGRQRHTDHSTTVAEAQCLTLQAGCTQPHATQAECLCRLYDTHCQEAVKQDPKASSTPTALLGLSCAMAPAAMKMSVLAGCTFEPEPSSGLCRV